MVHKRTDDAWQVLDIAVIETLTGSGEGRDAAEALARDYAQQHHHAAVSRRLAHGRTQSRGVTTHSPPAPGGCTCEPTRRSLDGVAGERSRPPRGLRCRVRLADGRVFCGELPAERHRALHIGLLHSQSNGLVEVAAGTRRDGTLHIHTRARADHFLPAGATGTPGWLEALLALAATHADRGEELFIAPAVRSHARGEKHAVAHTRALWVDIDQPGQLHHLWALLAEKPCHLLVESGGGGAHAYWLLDKPLPATDQNQPAGLRADPIERAHARIIHRLGVDGHGRPNVADSGVPRPQPAHAAGRVG